MARKWSKKKLFFGLIALLLPVLCYMVFVVDTKVVTYSQRTAVIQSGGGYPNHLGDVGRGGPTDRPKQGVATTSTFVLDNNNKTSPPPVLNSADYKLKEAAYRFQKNPVSASYKFASDLYFQPQLESDESSNASGLPEFLIKPAAVCYGSGPQSSSSDRQIADQDVFLLVMVLTSYKSEAQEGRQIIRDTYGSVAKLKAANGSTVWPGRKSVPARVALVFLLGRPPNNASRQKAQEEANRFGDLVVADFVDSYNNLTLKVLVGLHWTLTNCPTARYILKADDDIFVHLPLLTSFLLHRGQNNSAYGSIYPATRVQRGGRWKVSRKYFPFSTYPAYVSGCGYVLSADAARKIVQASRVVPRITVEDAYITGILAQATRIQRIHCTGFTNHSERKPNACKFLMDKKMIGNRMMASDKKSLWTILRIGDLRSCK